MVVCAMIGGKKCFCVSACVSACVCACVRACVGVCVCVFEVISGGEGVEHGGRI